MSTLRPSSLPDGPRRGILAKGLKGVKTNQPQEKQKRTPYRFTDEDPPTLLVPRHEEMSSIGGLPGMKICQHLPSRHSSHGSHHPLHRVESCDVVWPSIDQKCLTSFLAGRPRPTGKSSISHLATRTRRSRRKKRMVDFLAHSVHRLYVSSRSSLWNCNGTQVKTPTVWLKRESRLKHRLSNTPRTSGPHLWREGQRGRKGFHAVASFHSAITSLSKKCHPHLTQHPFSRMNRPKRGQPVKAPKDLKTRKGSLGSNTPPSCFERHVPLKNSRRYRLILIQCRILMVFLVTILLGLWGNRTKFYHVDFKKLHLCSEPSMESLHRLTSLLNVTVWPHNKSLPLQRPSSRLTLSELVMQQVLYAICPEILNSWQTLPMSSIQNTSVDFLCHHQLTRPCAQRWVFFIPWMAEFYTQKELCSFSNSPGSLAQYSPHFLMLCKAQHFNSSIISSPHYDLLTQTQTSRDFLDALQYMVNRWVTCNVLTLFSHPPLPSEIWPAMEKVGCENASGLKNLASFFQHMRNRRLIDSWTHQIQDSLRQAASHFKLEMVYTLQKTDSDSCEDDSILFIVSIHTPVTRHVRIFKTPLQQHRGLIQAYCLGLHDTHNMSFEKNHKETVDHQSLHLLKTPQQAVPYMVTSDQENKALGIMSTHAPSTPVVSFDYVSTPLTVVLMFRWCVEFVKCQVLGALIQGCSALFSLLKFLVYFLLHSSDGKNQQVSIPRDGTAAGGCTSCQQGSSHCNIFLWLVCRVVPILPQSLKFDVISRFDEASSSRHQRFYDSSLNYIFPWLKSSWSFISPVSCYNKSLTHFFTTPWVHLIFLMIWAPSIASPHPLTLVHLPRLFIYFSLHLYRFVFLYYIPNVIQTIHHLYSINVDFDFSDHIVFYLCLLLTLSLELVAAERSHCTSRLPLPSTDSFGTIFLTPYASTWNFTRVLRRQGRTIKKKVASCQKFVIHDSSAQHTEHLDNPSTRMKKKKSTFGDPSQHRLHKLFNYLIAPMRLSFPTPLCFVYTLTGGCVLALSFITLHTTLFFHSPREVLCALLIGFVGLYAPFWILIGSGCVSLDQFGILRYPCQKKNIDTTATYSRYYPPSLSHPPLRLQNPSFEKPVKS